MTLCSYCMLLVLAIEMPGLAAEDEGVYVSCGTAAAVAGHVSRTQTKTARAKWYAVDVRAADGAPLAGFCGSSGNDGQHRSARPGNAGLLRAPFRVGARCRVAHESRSRQRQSFLRARPENRVGAPFRAVLRGARPRPPADIGAAPLAGRPLGHGAGLGSEQERDVRERRPDELRRAGVAL